MKFGRLKGNSVLIQTHDMNVAKIEANSFIKAPKTVSLLFIVIFVFP